MLNFLLGTGNKVLINVGLKVMPVDISITIAIASATGIVVIIIVSYKNVSEHMILVFI